MNLAWNRTSQGVLPVRIVILAPSDWGKSYMAATLAQRLPLAPKDRIYCVGPVPSVANQIGVKWYNVPFPSKGPDAREECDAFFRNLNASNEQMFVILDESDLYMTGRGYGSPEIMEYINTGRNYGHGILCIARGSAEVSKNLLGTSNMILWGRVTEPNARDWAHQYMKGAVPDVDVVLQRIRKHEFLVYTPQDDPQYQGFVSVVHGELRTWDRNPNPTSAESTTPTDSSPTSTETSPPTPVESASIPAATAPSPTVAPPISAPNTTPSTVGTEKPPGPG